MDSHGKTHQKEQDDVVSPNPITLSKYSNRVELKTLLERSDGGSRLAGKRVVIGGWVKSSRAVKKDFPPPPPPTVSVPPPSSGEKQASPTPSISCTEIIQSKMNIFRKLFDVLSGGGKTYPIFDKQELAGQKAAAPPEYTLYFQLSDGSSVFSLQVVVDSAMSTVPTTHLMALGTCIVAEGVLRSAASAKHVVELQTEKLLHVGIVDPEKYPLSKKQLPLHMLRDFSHFRPRTTTVGSVTRVHSALTLASHTFLQHNGFQYVQVPIITTTGVGEMFRVTTLLGETNDKEEKKHVKEKDGFSIDTVKAAIKEKTKLIDHLRRSDSNREAMVAAVHDLKKTSDLATQLEMKQKLKAASLIKPEKLDFSKDFFGCEAYLTGSGRFHLESYACALGKVYTFGPTFIADKIDNARHLAEMWNVETEMAFSELDDAMDCADEFFKFLCKYLLEHRHEDMKFISKRVDKTITTRLEATASSSILRFSYTEAISLLQKTTNRTFETKPEWGVALTEEHLSYLTDEIYKGSVIIHSYPKEVKPFYIRLNDDKKTVAAFDLVVPKVGVVITGSQNEERFEILDGRIREFGLKTKEKYEWYLDLRRHGTVKHSGISLRMERMLLFATGLPDIKDAIPFPRSWGKANN